VPGAFRAEFAQARVERYVAIVEAETQERGYADTSRKRLAKLLVVSAVLHAPFTPWAALAGLLHFVSLHDDPMSDAPPITAIPIDILSDSEDRAAAGRASEASEPALSGGTPEPVPVAHPKKKRRELPDGGELDAGTEADAGKTAGDAGAEATGDAGAHDLDGGPTDAGARPISEPALAGGVRQITDPNANVRIHVYLDKIREHPLAPRLGQLLRGLYQWRDFFGPTAIDPVRDMDQMFIVGSQLRDTSGVCIVLKHHLPADRMRAAVDALVKTDPSGEWLDAGVPSAKFHADRAERRAVFPNAQTVALVTPAAYESTLKAGKSIRLDPGAGPEAVNFYLATPWRAFIGLPVTIPHSIKWARGLVTGLSDGGAVLDIEAEDESEGAARDDAETLNKAIDAVAQLDLGIFSMFVGEQKHRFLEQYKFTSDGTKIHGYLRATASQLSTGLDFASAALTDREQRHRAAPMAAPVPVDGGMIRVQPAGSSKAPAPK
jgi:hypothetical protein